MRRSPTATPLARRRAVLVWTAAGASLLALVGLGLATLVKSPAEVAAETAPPERSVLTTAVERRVLNETIVLRGDVVQSRTVDAAPSSAYGADRVVVTGVRVKAGEWVKAGQVLAEVSGRPVIVLAGKIPPYRDIRPGAEGKDVTQLQSALRALGFGVRREATFGPSTKAAVTRLYNSVGYPAPQTSNDDTEAVRQAENLVTDARRALSRARAARTGATTPTGTPPAGSTSTGTTRAEAVADARDNLDRAVADRDALVARTGPMMPLSEVIFAPAFPARVSAVTATVGRPVQSPMLRLAVGAVVAAGKLPGRDSQGVAVGQAAEIRSGDKTYPGKVTAVGRDAAAVLDSDAADPGTGQNTNPDGAGTGTQPGVAVVITPDRPLDQQLIGRDVRLTVIVQSSGEPALIVPLAAVYSTADAVTSVTVRGSGGAERTVHVTVGGSGDGFVEVTPADGAGLAAGDRVVVGRQ